MGNNRQSYNGDFGNDGVLDMITSRQSACNNGFVRFVDQGMQTVKDYHFKLDLKPILEEKHNESIQEEEYSMELISNNSMSQRSQSVMTPRKDALEEYFRMTVLANKISHQDLDKVCQIKSKILYQTAKNKNVPFHEWQGWVEQQLNQSYLDSIYAHQNNTKSLLRTSSLNANTDLNNDLISQRKNSTNDREQLRKFISDSNLSKKGYMSLGDGQPKKGRDK